MARNKTTKNYDEFQLIYRQAYPNAVVTLINPGHCETEASGVFNSASFNPNGHLSVRAILDLYDINGYSRSEHTDSHYLDPDLLGCLVFIGSLRLTCEPELYDCSLTKQPVKVVNNLVYIGKSSIKTRIRIHFPEVEKPVAELELGIIFVDPKTRKPSVLPDWWRAKHAPYCEAGGGPIPPPTSDPNLWTGKYVRQEDIYVQIIDLDPNRHCHFTSFVRFCCEAFGRSQYRHFGFTSRGDPLRDVRTLVCTFKGEARLGDVLKVYFVQDLDDKDTYHFRIVNEAKAVIFESRLQFFPQITSKM
ncbi:hypothetical protein EGW08_020925 [Elysia chlorotica]|uniref:Uncharacterized protein n=1 Tax=Elysia chlorotica TaxID=188477 RepID=A0A3S1BNT2_ELYCH|nr:hypothetical protein EGW08_020925 [Elysia chlorotica]